MQRNNVDRARTTLVETAIEYCKKLPNDADLGKELRKLLTAHAERTFFGTGRCTDCSDKKNSTSN